MQRAPLEPVKPCAIDVRVTPVPDMNGVVGTHDLLFVTLDTLRLDVAQSALSQGRTPHLAHFLGGAWEGRHTPGGTD